MRISRAWALAAAIGMAGAAAGAEAPATGGSPDVRCAQLQGATGFPNTTITKTQRVLADAKAGLPSFCEITALVSPVAGSKITAIYRLPDNWNGRMLGLGGGGWAGQVGLPAAAAGLPRGYAVAQTDAGHADPNGADPRWTLNNPVAVTD